MTFCYILPVECLSKCPAMISQHSGTPLALVLHFHVGNVVVKSLSVHITHCPEIF